MNGLPPDSKRGTALRLALAVLLVMAVFTADFLTGSELSLSLLYLLPIGWGAWIGGRGAGAALASLSAFDWLAAILLTGQWRAEAGWLLTWNTAVEFGIFLTVALSVAGLKRSLDHERSLKHELEQAYRRLDREQQIVGDLQRELLPAAPPALPGWRFAVHYATSTRAGGDYYDFFPLKDGRLGLVIADASGHGTPAAVVMAMLRALLHTAPEGLAAPRQVLEQLDTRLYGNTPRSIFATACWVTLDPRSGDLEYASAGHCPALVVRARSGRVEPLTEGGGPPLGLFDAAAYPAGRARLEPGDMLVLYTDGLTEAMDPAHEMFGEERLCALLEAGRDAELEEVRERLLDAWQRHVRGAPAEDDLTLLLVRRAPAA